MSYFGRIAGRASGGQGPSTLAQPVVRSGSPLVEFDQRLHLTSDTGEPAFDMTQAPIHGAAGGDALEGPGPDAAESFAAAPRQPSSFEPQAGPRLRSFGSRQRAVHDVPTSGPADERPSTLDFGQLERPGAGANAELGATSIEVISSHHQPAGELGADAGLRPRTPARNAASRVDAGLEVGVPAPLVPTDLATARSAEAHTSIEEVPLTPKVRPSAEPAKLEPATRNRTDPNSVLGEALAKVSAWMRRPAPVTPSTPGRAETAERLAAEPFGTPSLPKLVIGQIEIEVITPKEPPRPATRRPRALPAAAAPRPAYSSVAKQSFGSRQR